MLKVAIITPRSTAPVSRSIIDALKARSITVMKLNPGRISLDLDPENVDFVQKYFSNMDARGAIIRGIGTSKTKKIYHRLGILGLFEACGAMLVNSRQCLEVSTNKAITSALLMRAGIPTPRTIVCEGFKRAQKAYHDLGGDVILKPLFGSKGVGVMRITDEGYASNVFYNLDRLDEVFYLQEYFEHGYSDIRAMVLGDQVLCAMERVSKPDVQNPWKTNVFVGASGKPHDITEALSEMAINAAKTVSGEFVGVDLIHTDKGPKVIEVNAVPGFTELQKTTKIDIPGAFVDHFLHLIRN